MKTPEKNISKVESKPISNVKPIPETQVVSSPEERDKLRQLSQLSLWLDGYDDLFSDFDPRPYSQRALSDDFLSAAKKMIREKRSGKIELNLLMPSDKRNSHHENLIRKRLREYFKRQHDYLLGRKFQKKKEGAIFIAVGVIVMITATLLYLQEQSKNFLMSFLIILLEPAGWFLFWEGLNLMIFEANKNPANLDFNNKLASCDVSFSSY